MRWLIKFVFVPKTISRVLGLALTANLLHKSTNPLCFPICWWKQTHLAKRRFTLERYISIIIPNPYLPIILFCRLESIALIINMHWLGRSNFAAVPYQFLSFNKSEASLPIFISLAVYIVLRVADCNCQPNCGATASIPIGLTRFSHLSCVAFTCAKLTTVKICSINNKMFFFIKHDLVTLLKIIYSNAVSKCTYHSSTWINCLVVWLDFSLSRKAAILLFLLLL